MLSLPITILLLIAVGIVTYTATLWAKYEKQKKAGKTNTDSEYIADEVINPENIEPESVSVDPGMKPIEEKVQAEATTGKPGILEELSVDYIKKAQNLDLLSDNEEEGTSTEKVVKQRGEGIKETEGGPNEAKTERLGDTTENRTEFQDEFFIEKEEPLSGFVQVSLEEVREKIRTGEVVLEDSLPKVQAHTAPIGYEPVGDFEQLTQPYYYPIVKMPFPNSKVLYPQEFKSKKRGVSERAFHRSLLKAFGKRIKRNLSLNFDGAKHDYEPDFAFIDPAYELFVDIEVDEPYSGISRKPMHYQGCYDQDRDRYFNQNGWVVIRFTEEQVVTQPLYCCCFIGKVLNLLIEDYNFPEEQSELLKATKQWTYEEAEQLARDNFRESYLGVEFEHQEPDSPTEIETESELPPQAPISNEDLDITDRDTIRREALELENREYLTQLLTQGDVHITFTFLGKERLVQAQQIKQERISWILEGYDYVESDIATFDLGKMEHLKQIDSPFLFEAEEVSAEQFRDYIEMANDNNLYVQMYYRKWNGEYSTRTLSLFQRDFVPGETRWWYTKNLYVRAFCNLRKDDRTFKFERIQWMKVLNLAY